MVDFKKRLATKPTQKPVDPILLYDTLDRASDKGPLRPAQTAILKTWHENRRGERDLILKLHTGQGKTLIGFLILQSKLNELAEPAVYLCPNNFLIDQTCAQAKQFGIRFCTTEDGDLPDEFFNGKSLLITSVQKMFNGRTKFHLGHQSTPVSYILMDDAHACIDAIRDAFSVRLERESTAYQRILDLFTEALTNQGAGTFAEIKSKNPDSLLPVPYWDWQEKHAEVVGILSEAVHAESAKKYKAGIWFVWPLLKDMIQHCQCVVSGHALEIAPYLPPLEVFGSFCKAKHRVFMSATVTNDAFLVKGLRLSPEIIKNPLVFKDERWSGEKMILVPSLIHESLDRSTIVNAFGKTRIGRDHGLVVLSPSFRMTADWEKCGSHVAKKDSIGLQIEQLRQGQFDSPLVIVNRYDGIDLPDVMCRILVFDSMPYSESLIDRYEEDCRATSEITAILCARTIEQGLGRSVRGEKDYCIIIVIGSELVKFIRNHASRRHLSAQTRVQIEIGLDIADMAEQEIKKGGTPLEALYGLISQCLKRDEDWKGFYVQEMNKVMPEPSATDILDVFSLELEAALLFQQGEVAKAVASLQNLIDKQIKDQSDKYWYLQEIARFTFTSSKADSNRLQVSAHRGNRYLMKPRTGVEFTKLQVISQKRVEAIIGYIKAFPNYEQLALAIDDILARLQFGVKSDSFEQAFKELGNALGFSSERPDKEWKEGPDNLWCVRAGQYLLVECKNEVDLKRAEIGKDESGQMNNACAWFERNYKGTMATKILIIPTNRLGHAAGFVQEVVIMRDKELRNLRKNVKAFFAEFKTADLSSLSEKKVQECIDTHQLSVEALLTIYGEKVRQ
jgi:replicative superfamily II helicase